ncbi:hypothetical protein LGL73_13815, partial [Staphylococcus aureus]|uniref:hypothetical protein n=1 Tax=Staphylococcus aureus TaxID=1280 RepID=UPI001CF37201
MSTDNKQVIEELKKRHQAEQNSVDSSKESGKSSNETTIDAEAIMKQLADMQSEVNDLRSTNN